MKEIPGEIVRAYLDGKLVDEEALSTELTKRRPKKIVIEVRPEGDRFAFGLLWIGIACYVLGFLWFLWKVWWKPALYAALAAAKADILAFFASLF